MPKDNPEDEAPKKKPAHDEEDDEFDKEIEGSMDEDEAPVKSAKKEAPEEDDDDPLDREDEEDLDPDLMKAGSKELFPESHEESDEEMPAPKPTFKYNVEAPTMLPSDNPVTTSKHTLDDLSAGELGSSEDDIAPQPTRRPFQVDRGMSEAPQPTPSTFGNDDDDFEITAPQRPQRPPVMQQEEYEHDNLAIPPIRKQSPMYPPHQTRGEEYGDDEFSPRVQQPQTRQTFREPNTAYNPYAPDQSQRFGYRDRQPKGASKWHIIILLLIGGAVIGATVYLLQNQFNFPGQPSSDAAPTPTAQITEATPVPTPTPAPIERSQFKVRVLNGTTEAGLAKKVMDKLKGLGYQSDRTGNAPKQDYTQSVIRVKEGDSTISAQLTKDLSPDYTPTITPDLPQDDKADVEVILGEK